VLVLAQPSGAVAIVAEDHGCVVEGHAGDGVRPAARTGGTGAPGIPAQQDSRSCTRRGCGRGRRLGWRARCRAGSGRGRCSRTRGARTRGLGDRFRARAHDDRRAGATGQREQSATADDLRTAGGPFGRGQIHDGHDTNPDRRSRCRGGYRGHGAPQGMRGSVAGDSAHRVLEESVEDLLVAGAWPNRSGSIATGITPLSSQLRGHHCGTDAQSNQEPCTPKSMTPRISSPAALSAYASFISSSR